MRRKFKHKWIKESTIVINTLSVFFYAPNYLSLWHPIARLIPLFSMALLVFYLFAAHQKLSPPSAVLGIYGWSCLVLVTGLISFGRFGDVSPLLFSVSILIKVLHLTLLFSIISSTREFQLVVRWMVLAVVFFAIHTILQMFAYSLGLVSITDVYQTQGYTFYRLGWFGHYRISFTLLGVQLVRTQSFFQEPGFLAFYLIFGLFLLEQNAQSSSQRHTAIFEAVIVIAVITTLSLNGLIFLLFYFFWKYKISLKTIIPILVLILLGGMILNSENQYLSKAGSFRMRIDHMVNAFEVIVQPEVLLLGIGFGMENNFMEGRVNNFLVELVLYSSVVGLITFVTILAFTILNRSKRSISPLVVGLLYSLTTPMLWSPMVLAGVLLADLSKRRGFVNRTLGSTA